MALRAGYYGLKRSIKNKLTLLAASTPADISPDNPIAGKNDVLTGIDLLNDTVGWTGKSKVPNTASSTSSGNVAFTVNENKTVQVVANNNSAYQALTINSNIGDYLEVGKTYTLCGTPVKPSGASYRQFELRIRKNSNNDVVAADVGNSVEFTYTQEMAQADTYRLDIAIFDGTTYDGLFAPMITTPEEYALSHTYEPYHESVEEILDRLIGGELSTTGLTYTNCEYVAGGYVISGNICTVNIRVKATADAGISINGLPNAKISNNSNYIPATMHKVGGAITDSIPAYCTSDGLLSGFQDAVTDSNYLISASYLIRSSVVANREISADPEVKEPTKKATKKKVIKEEEE